MLKEIAILYPVAGLSTRFKGKVKSFSKVGPNGESLIEYSLNQALNAGFSKIIFVVGEHTEHLFKKKFGKEYKGIPIHYAYQKFDKEKRDKPWGTGEALCCAREIIDCPFVYCNGDDIYGEDTFKKLFDHLQKSNDSATIGYKLAEVIPKKGSVNRGIFHLNETGYIKELIETFNIEANKLDKQGLTKDSPTSMNIFAFHQEIIDILYNNLLTFKLLNLKDRKIEFLISNEVSKLINKNKVKMRIYPSPDKCIGITNPEDEEVVRGLLKEKGV